MDVKMILSYNEVTFTHGHDFVRIIETIDFKKLIMGTLKTRLGGLVTSLGDRIFSR